MGFGKKGVIIAELSLETVSIWAMQSEWEQNLIITLFSLPSLWHQYSIIVPHPQSAAKHAPTHVQQLQNLFYINNMAWQLQVTITVICACLFVYKGWILTSENECVRRRM